MISNPSRPEPDATALEIFNRQNRACLDQPEIPLKKRLELLKTIENILIENDQAICQAVNTDFGTRSFHETRILEISPCLMGLRYTCRRLKKWMKPQRRYVSLVFPGGMNRVIRDGKNCHADRSPESGAGHPGTGGQIPGDPGR
jgi:coniferyl-aldehyde dehydrogenase